ncbi:uncharacterized protein A4U43_C04F10490 [Asparagus officinalis]|uniref:Uncharacterized protein n=1 Tax=Asparagus officinalis TaxID=4686 RepID=A0A5P1F1M7_ASPOF|nr:uncharacterized protein LOC109837031 [Asparagus officinalis]ONK71613.1 uncharacterized protein A4U43_C04F10490 [Asparagus officinalis]
MKPKANGSIQRAQRVKHVQGEGPNWVLIAGGALLSTLSFRIGCRLKQAFDAKRSNNAHNTLKENGNCVAQRRPATCKLHSNSYCYTQEEDDGCYHCLSGNLNGETNIKHSPSSPMSKDGDHSLPLVKIPTAESHKDGNGVMWASSPDRLELPRKPFHRSNSSDSPSFSESGSDIYSKREVIQKLRQQLKRRDEMILEMQTQILDLQTSLSAQMTHSAHLQTQVDCSNRELFDSEREIQRLRKVIADHCVAEAASPERTGTNNRNWQPESVNGGVNGYLNNGDVELHCVGLEKGRGDAEKVDMLKREVGELKEVIEGKEFLLQSYKEQKVELSSKVKELQQKLALQVPNIL